MIIACAYISTGNILLKAGLCIHYRELVVNYHIHHEKRGSVIKDKLQLGLEKRNSKYYTWGLAVLVVIAWVMDNYVLGRIIGGMAGNYLLRPLMWLILIAAVWRMPRLRTSGKFRLMNFTAGLAVMCVLIGILLMALRGLIGGIARSPYDHSLVGIALNLLLTGTMVAGVEMSRAWLLNRLFLRRRVWGIAVLGLLYTFFTVSVNKLLSLKTGIAAVKFFGTEFLPSLGQSLLASYLAALGGPVPAMIYHGALAIFEKMSPYLPNSAWVSDTLLGNLAPVLGFLLVCQLYQEESGQVKARETGEKPLGWAVTSLVMVLILWFALGVFSVYPRVIVSGSMVPEINIGDVIIVKEAEGEQMEVGDVILYQLADVKVAHRIIEKMENNGQITFVTKGDANEAADAEAVYPQQVLGEIVYVVPKAGWVSIALRKTD